LRLSTRRRLIAVASVGSIAALALSGCSSTPSTHADKTVNVLMVNNPQMVELQKLAPIWEKQTGIHINFTVQPEDNVRDKISTSFSAQDGQYDVATISNYETPTFAKNGWLSPLTAVANDKTFDQGDILKPFTTALTYNGVLYGEPFYGESSFLMYRKDVFQAKGLTMPANPTWQQVADLAAKVDNAQPDMRGICLRGQPGWGEIFAPLTTVVNTFGGTWFDKDWQAQVDAPAFEQATNFYVNLIQQHGEVGAAQSGYTECLNDLQQGKVAMWYDSTAAAGSLEAPGSPVAGKIGYVAAPVDKTTNSGWLYTWSWGVEKAGKNQAAAIKFVEWASSKQYEDLVGQKAGWANVPSGKRASTFSNPGFLKAGSAFAAAEKSAIESANPSDPGVQPRPAPGIQFVAIPEFADFATTISQDVSDAIAGRETVAQALTKGQATAEAATSKYRK
jgi:sorbitol/mannitol transport system substrate-binding protein